MIAHNHTIYIVYTVAVHMYLFTNLVLEYYTTRRYTNTNTNTNTSTST